MRDASCFDIARTLALFVACYAVIPNALADDSPDRRVTVSGISSGGYAAVQTHIALSNTVSGAGIIAGGPYHCAEGSIVHALGRCISGEGLDVAHLVESTSAAALEGTIDPVESLADDRVWLFHGKLDPVVNVAVMQGLREFYAAFLPDDEIASVEDIAATHGWPTLGEGISCGEMGADFINACDYDAAGEMLQQLYGPLNPRTAALEANLQILDQTPIYQDGSGFAETGYAYLPEYCAGDTAKCRLHIAFHGCRQGKEFVDDRFARMAGLNEWAESNRIIVLYPQVEKSPFNPQGCWDWWGYTGPDYDRRHGKQIEGIAALIAAWSGQSQQ